MVLLQCQFEVDAVDTDEGLNREELVAWAADCRGNRQPVDLTDRIDAEVIESLPRTLVISNVAVGYRRQPGNPKADLRHEQARYPDRDHGGLRLRNATGRRAAGARFLNADRLQRRAEKRPRR